MRVNTKPIHSFNRCQVTLDRKKKKRSQECIVSSYVYVFLVVVVGYIDYYEVEGQTKRKNDEEGLYFMTGWPSTIGSKPRVHTTET